MRPSLVKDVVALICLVSGGAAGFFVPAQPEPPVLLLGLLGFLTVLSDLTLVTPWGKASGRVSPILGLALLFFGRPGAVTAVVTVAAGSILLSASLTEKRGLVGDVVRTLAPLGAGGLLSLSLPAPFPGIGVCLGFLILSLLVEPRRFLLRPSLLTLFCAPWLSLAILSQASESPWAIPLIVPVLFALSRGKDEAFPALVRLRQALKHSQARRMEESEKVRRLAVLLKAANRMAQTFEEKELKRILYQACLESGVEEAKIELSGGCLEEAIPLLDGKGSLNVKGDLTGLQRDQLVLLSKIFTTCWQKVELHNQVLEALEETRRSQAVMVESSRMAAIGLVAAGIAHEVNTPLGAIQLSAELVQSQLKPDDQRIEKHLQSILRATERAQKAVERTLFYARPMGTEEKETFSLQEVVEDALELLSHRISRSQISVETDLAAGLELYGERQAFFTLVFNLVLNGAEAAQEREPHKVWVRTGVTESELILEVEDSGSGVPENLQDKIFQAFFTTRAGGEGTGLGLHLAGEAAGLFGGRLILYGRRHHGAVFRAIFPLATRGE